MTFGAIALKWLEQEGVDQMVKHVLDYGVNHFGVAPTYGDAELKLGPKLRQHREEIFLGCKTQKRGYDGARQKPERSLNRLGVEKIDLYQVHGLEHEEELEVITGDDGALVAVRDVKAEGHRPHRTDESRVAATHPRCHQPNRRPRIADVPVEPRRRRQRRRRVRLREGPRTMRGRKHRNALYQGVRRGSVATHRRTS
ncbi:aldo/keto reductase [Halogeometricum borinquense DSM 11551]|uniref:Aldo/keto reductase n=1 Tax=Halogeometricum borinquense (strain ATCC 700274 / DSM 11551 / JCM 10706 / KCTC 4070 / PR3) TaxID=469382 RepID=L9ULB6_HALBP|nr:aldo/keto reductase [Halogeometricum borinquense DSM 11551]